MAKFQYRIKTAACKICGSTFEFSHATGRHPSNCSEACASKAAVDSAKKRPRLRCAEVGCENMARPGRQPICAMHYHRRYRTGTTYKEEPAYRGVSTGGYSYVYADHPMAGKKGIAYEHRVVAYDHYGDGPHSCHWCGDHLDWSTACVDHRNEDKSDNRIGNLVVACGNCNRHRSLALRFMRRLLPSRFAEMAEMVRVACHREPEN